MPTTATIEEVSYVNSFPSQYGDANGKLHAYRYVFDDGVIGTANHKAAPNWGPGAQVDYTITGDHRGMNKLKVSAVGAQQGPGGPPQRQQAPQRASAPAPRSTPPPARQTAAGAVYMGEAVGHALNNAVQMAMRETPPVLAVVTDELFWKSVWSHASSILRMSDALKSGRLAPKPHKDGAPRDEPEPEPEPTHGPLPPRAATRPQPGPDGQAFSNDDGDDDSPPF